MASAFDYRVGHRDPLDTACEHPLVRSNAAQQTRIETAAIDSTESYVVQGRTKQLERRFFGSGAVIPERALLKHLGRYAAERGDLEMEERRAVVAAMSEESRSGCR